MRAFEIHDNGKMQDRTQFTELVNQIIQAGKRPVVWLGYKGEKRSQQFNRFYFGVIVKRLADLTGATHDQVHQDLKIHVLGLENRETIKGHVVQVPKQTRHMTTEQFQSFVDEAESLATEMGVDLTDLEENVKQKTS